MNNQSFRLPLFLAIGLAAAAVAIHSDAAPLEQHPAVIVHARAAAIDPNTFIVAPPASTTWVHGHSNEEHPAVRVARMVPRSGIDGNTFTVQPPASTRWTLGPGEQTAPLVIERTALLR